MAEPFNLLVLDCDGTVTDAEKEGTIPGRHSPGGLSFVDGYLMDVAAICGIALSEAQTVNHAMTRQMREDPTEFCFEFDGQVVAPGCVDPYIRTGIVARRLMDDLGIMADNEAALAVRDRVLAHVIYGHNYLQRTSTHFRPGAEDLFGLLRGRNVHIISNSGTDGVVRKIGRLREAGWMLGLSGAPQRVHGDGMKMYNKPGWTQHGVPEDMELPGLQRPVLLRRMFYFDKLEMLRRRYRLTWGDMLVVGDIFELDLALPFALGCSVAILANEFTPAYELDFLQMHDRGHVLTDLAQVGELFLGS